MAETKYNPDVNKNLKDKKYQDYLKSKGFNIKRDKGGKGFSMVIQKKIKGFEETDMAGERIDELSKQTLKRYVKGATRDIGKRAYSAGLKGGADKPEAKQDVQRAEKHEKYIPKAVHRVQGKYYPKYVREKNPTYGGTRKYGGGSDYKSYKETHGEKGEPKARYTRKEEYEQMDEATRKSDVDKIRKHYYGKSERAAKKGFTDDASLWKIDRATNIKAGLRGREKTGKLTGYTDNVKNRSTKTEEYEMSEEELNELSREKLERYREKANVDLSNTDAKQFGRKNTPSRNAELERRANKRLKGYDTASKKLGEEEEYEMEEEEEIEEPNVSDLVLNAIEQKPLDFQQAFADLMQQRIEDAVAERKLEVAAAFTGDDRSQYEAGENEPEEGEEEEEEGEAEEEPEAEEESDEEE